MPSEPPWRADRPLTATLARSAIAASFPDVDVSRVEHLGSGWEFDAYRTADDWVFRFPRRREHAALFDTEAAVHGLVRPVLEPGVAIPRVERRGAPGPDFPYAFAGHRMIEGVTADPPDEGGAMRLARELGDVLTRIHSVPTAVAATRGVPREEDATRAWMLEAMEVAPRLEDLEAVGDALRWLAGGPELPPPHPGPHRLLHNDLCPDHLLVDRVTGRLVGLIDWTDAALGDPVLDFVVLLAWKGRNFVEEVRAAYGLPLDGGFPLRLTFLARVLSLVWLDEARRQRGDVDKHVRWVHHAFEGRDGG